eukprot:1723599-Alexandrium_andersonii.AAC.1
MAASLDLWNRAVCPARAARSATRRAYLKANTAPCHAEGVKCVHQSGPAALPYRCADQAETPSI